MIATVSQNRYGHLEINPVSERVARRYDRYLAENSDQPARRNGDALVYIQSEDDVAYFLASLPRGKAADVQEGWTVKVRIDAYTVGSYVGYDAAEHVK